MASVATCTYQVLSSCVEVCNVESWKIKWKKNYHKKETVKCFIINDVQYTIKYTIYRLKFWYNIYPHILEE